jgi:peptidoglycan/LPS O-acetylase OafA/YrhL
LPLIIGCAVLIIINKKSLFNRKILGSKPMCFIGKISYSFYIWHQGIIMLFDLNKYISIGVAVIAILVYQVEDRIRISKHPLTVPFILGFGSILLIVAFIILFS